MGITLKDLDRNCENCKHSVYSNGNQKFICDSERAECKANFRNAEAEGLKYPRNCGGFEVKSKIKKNQKRYILKEDLILQFITAGNSYFVLHSTKTNEDFAFNVKIKKNNTVGAGEENLWFVHDWQGVYLGAIRFNKYIHAFEYKMNENITGDAKRVRDMKSLTYVMNKAYNYESIVNLEAYHTGFCAKCGKPLKEDMLSYTMGFGTYCAQQVKDELFKIIYDEEKIKLGNSKYLG